MGRGGKRAGAGRKPSGLVTRKASISQAAERWELIDNLVKHYGCTQSEMLAQLLYIGMEQKKLEIMEPDGTIKWGHEDGR
ncbi:hypothetical protein D3C84_1162080 [compost metagenome]